MTPRNVGNPNGWLGVGLFVAVLVVGLMLQPLAPTTRVPVSKNFTYHPAKVAAAPSAKTRALVTATPTVAPPSTDLPGNPTQQQAETLLACNNADDADDNAGRVQYCADAAHDLSLLYTRTHSTRYLDAETMVQVFAGKGYAASDKGMARVFFAAAILILQKLQDDHPTVERDSRLQYARKLYTDNS